MDAKLRIPLQIAPMNRFLRAVGIGLWLGLTVMWAVGQTHPPQKPVNKQAKKAYDAATLAYMQRDWPEAWSQVNRAVQKDSTFFDGWMLLAQLARERERWPEAAQALERGYALQPTGFPAGRIQWVEALHRSGRYADALDAWQSAQSKPAWTQTRRLPEEAKLEAERWEKLGAAVAFAVESLAHPVQWDAAPLPGQVNTADPEYHPALTLDGQHLIFTRLVGGSRLGGVADVSTRAQEDFFMSQWDETLKAWGLPKPLLGINSPGNEGAPALRGDGRKLIFTACETPFEGYGERSGKGSCDLFESRWNPSKNRFEPAVNLGLPNTPGWESQPALSADGRMLVFVRGTRNADGSKGQDLFVSHWTEAGNWSAAQPLPGEVNTSGTEENPVLHPDGSTLYFASDGHPGMGGMDLFVSRLQADGTWGEVTNLGYPINTLAHENSLVVGPDGKMALFATDREAPGNSDLWSMSLPQEAMAQSVATWSGYVRDAVSLRPIASEVVVLHPDGRVYARMQSDALDGRFVLPIAPEGDWIFQVEEPGYAFYSMQRSGAVSGSGSQDVEILLQPLAPGTTLTLRDIRFATGSSQLETGFQPELESLAAMLVQNPELRVRLVGHTDATGLARENLVLSEDRARAVRDFLLQRGIDDRRLESEGRGATEPIAGNDTAAGRAANRRTEVVVLD